MLRKIEHLTHSIENSRYTPIFVDEIDEFQKLKLLKKNAFCKKVISGQWKGHSGKSITHIVNIGIGG